MVKIESNLKVVKLLDVVDIFKMAENDRVKMDGLQNENLLQKFASSLCGLDLTGS